METFFQILGWIITGSIAGYVASLLLRAERQGCIVNIILGVVGAFVGGFVMNRFLFPAGITGWPPLDTIIHAIVGAVIVLIAIELIIPGKQLGVRGESGSSRGSRRRRR
jgi:uncharacterized membrane protein YeaQ/YmgE (transglycosylase-associated protein family)